VPKERALTIPTHCDQPAATAPSCAGLPRSEPPHAADS
jgi:hypothetical protein